MKNSMLILLRKIRLLGWSCLWSIPICLLLLSRPAAAQDITFDLDPMTPPCPAASNMPHTFTFVEGASDSQQINVVDSPANVNWEFDPPPIALGPYPACTGTGDSRSCSNVDITIPSGTVSGASADVTATNAGPVSTYGFGLTVEDDANNSITCSRSYDLDIVEGDIPFDLGFVLDRSGSMSSAADPNNPGGDSRWQVLQDSVTHFANDLVTFNTAHSSPGDNNVGVTLFSTNVIGNSVLPNSLTNIDGFPEPPDPDSLPAEVEDELNQSPAGLTAMGSGLQTALQQWGGALPVPPDTSRSRVVVLFSDGRQNQNPRVNLDGRGFNDGTDINASYPTGDGSVKIITMGVGGPDNDYLNTLQNLAAENRGVYISTTDGIAFNDPDNISWMGTLDNAFEYAIAPALNSNSPLMIASYEGQLTSNSLKLPNFAVNFNAKQLVIDFLFDRKLERPELEEILKNVHIYRDGEEISDYFQPRIASDYTQWASLVTDYREITNKRTITQIPSAGDYTVKLVKPEAIKDMNFQAFPFADDDHLEANWGVNPVIPRVGEPMQIYADLKWRGQPIKDATVEAIVLDQTYVGDLLARNQFVIDPDSSQRDVSASILKYLYLLREDPEFVEQLTFKPQKIQLKHQGDGVYMGTNTPAVPGGKPIFITVKGKDPERGTVVERLFFLNKNIRDARIDLDASNITTQFDANGTAIINWRPITVNGLFIGPGNDTAFTIKGAERTRIFDDQLGGYQISLDGINPDSKLAIDYLGDEIYRGPLCGFGKTQFGALDLDASRIRTKVDADGSAIISWRPVTKNRRRPIGAGQADAIDIRGPKRTNIEDNGDGSYTMRLLGVASDSRISVRLSCDEVYRGPLSEFKSVTTGGSCQTWLCRVRDRLRRMPGRMFPGA